jgi:ubiquinone/menaquinone biosynthesis C-methylase UbiE
VGTLNFGNAVFDAIFSMNGFHAFPDKEAAFHLAARVLKPSGMLLSTFYLKGARFAADIFVKAFLQPKGFFTPPYWTQDELRAILRRYYSELYLDTQGGMAILRCVK